LDFSLHVEFMDANETPRPVTICTNTMKIKQRDLAQVVCLLSYMTPTSLLNERVVNFVCIKWIKEGFRV